jgi:hypothetical protein
LAAVEAQGRAEPSRAADAAFVFLKATDAEDPRYERARVLMAQALWDLGLHTSAAMIARDVAVHRRDPLAAGEALGVVRAAVEAGRHDEDGLVTSFIAAGAAQPDARHAGFVAWHQAVDLSRRRLDPWADAVSARVEPDDAYHGRTAWLRVVRHLADGELTQAREGLDRLASADLPPDVAAEVERARPRLAYALGDTEQALTAYKDLGDGQWGDGALVLERAWARYADGDARGALGQLLVLDTPSFHGGDFPERHLLRALSLRRLCWYGPARQAATAFYAEYGPMLSALRRGEAPEAVPGLQRAATARPSLRGVVGWRDAVVEERRRVKTSGLRGELVDWLSDHLERAQRDADARVDGAVKAESARVAEELLATEEGIRLVVHEIGVAALRGRQRPAGVEEKPPVERPLSGDVVLFGWGGELWADELDDLIVVAEDRCAG